MELPEGWFPEDDIAVYRTLYYSLPNNARTAELGCLVGRSLCAVADIIKEKNIHVDAIDTFLGTQTSDEAWAFDKFRGRDLVAEFAANILRFGVAENVHIMKGKTEEVAKETAAHYDLVFIDADHSYDAVQTDIKAWKPKVVPGGILAGDDYTRASVINAVDELLSPVTKEASLWIYRC